MTPHHLRNKYLAVGQYQALFGHLLTPYSSPAFRERFKANAEEDAAARPNNGVRLAKFKQGRK